METKVKFKCLLSGNTFEFSNSFDIEDMRKHPQYQEVLEETIKASSKKKAKGD